MLTCKQVSRSLAEHDYQKLGLLPRLGLKLHVAMCVVCGRYNRQVMTFQDGVRALLRCQEQEEGPLADHTRLPPEARERLRNTLQDAGRKS